MWDGRVQVSFRVQQGDEISTDDIELLVAPVLVHNHLDRVEQVLSIAGDKTHFPWQHRFIQDLSEELAGTELSKPFLLRNDHDLRAQDFVELGYVSMPSPVGPITSRAHMIKSKILSIRKPGVYESPRYWYRCRASFRRRK